MPGTPPPTLDEAQPKDVPQTGKERVLGALGGVLAAGGGRDRSESPLVQAMEKHHQQRIDLAQKHYKDFQTYTGILATGIDPDTNAPLKAEDAEKYYNLREAASQELEKTAGVNKDVKGKLQKLKMLADHIIKMHPKAGQADAGGNASGGPGAGGAEGDRGQDAGAGGGAPSPRMTPPPTMSSTDSLKQNADAPRLREEMEDQRALRFEKAKAQTAHEFKMAEIAEAAKAKAANPTGTTRSGTPTSLSEAKKLAAKGMTFKSAETGDNLDLEDYDDTMMLVPLYQSGKVVGYYPASQRQTHITYNNKVMAVPALNQMDLPKGAGTELGEARVGTVSGSEQGIDPVTGTTITKRTSTPMTGAGAAGRPQNPSGAGAGAGTGGGHGDLLPTATTAKRIAPIREAMTQVLGDPSQPDFKSLGDYAKMADDPAATKHVGEALQYVLNGMEQAEKSAGSLLTLLQNYGGIPQSLVQSQVAIHKELIGKLTPKEAELFNASISSLSTFVGMRSLTGGSAAQFSVKALERDLPLVGFNVFDSKAFKSKMGRAAESVYTGSRTVPLTATERKHIDEAVKKWNAAAEGKPRMTPPPKSGASGVVKWKRDASGKPVQDEASP
jgi:hypothetical protein